MGMRGCREEQEWLACAVEQRAQRPVPAQEQLTILRALLRTDLYARFLAERFPPSKVRPAMQQGPCWPGCAVVLRPLRIERELWR